jgi:hypothetical protein
VSKKKERADKGDAIRLAMAPEETMSDQLTFTASERKLALAALVTAFRAGDDVDESIAYALGVVTIFRSKAKDSSLLRALLGDNDCEECGTPAGHEHAPYCRSGDDNDCEERDGRGWSMEWLKSNTSPSFKICDVCESAIRTAAGFTPCADQAECRFVPSLFQDRRPGHGPGRRR